MTYGTLTCALLLLVTAAGCSGAAPPQGAELQGHGQGPDVNPDPCAGKTLPPCPQACTKPPGEIVGSPCTAGDRCGNDIGDGCSCASGKWECSPHAPLGGPGACNKTCR